MKMNLTLEQAKAKYQIQVVDMVWTTDVIDCQCCGRTDLKGTFRIDTPTDRVYFGSTCAKNKGVPSKYFKPAKSKFSKNYNQVGYLSDNRTVEILEVLSKLGFDKDSKAKATRLTKQLRDIREEYRR